MLSVHNVSKRYANEVALAGTSLGFPHEKTTVIVGQSGSGKSTLLRICVGLVSSDTGYVELCGEKLTQSNLQSLRHKLGYVIQEGGLFPHLNARENILLLARYLNRVEFGMERVKELTHICHLSENLLDRYPHELSGGQRQRIGLMRALVLDPSVLLLDEPLGALDPMMRSQLQNDLKDIFEALKKTVVMVTHDLAEAQFLGDHIVLMNQAMVVQQGTIDDLVHRPRNAFVSAFLNAQRGFQCTTFGA